MKMTRIFSILVVCLFLGSSAFAFGIPGLKSGGDSSVDVGALENDQSALMQQVHAALTNLADSQVLMADALGLKEMAAVATQNADSLKAGEFTGKDDMEKQISSSQEVSDAIQAKLGESGTLSDESKAKFAEALPPYGKGAVGVVSSSKTAVEKAKTVSSSRDLTILKTLGPLLSYSKKAPDLISNFTSSTGSIINFCKANGIDTSSLESETAAW